jgi:hypothetical protein
MSTAVYRLPVVVEVPKYRRLSPTVRQVTEFDAAKKGICPLGAFVGYGNVTNDYIMIKGCCHSVKKTCDDIEKDFVEANFSKSN